MGSHRGKLGLGLMLCPRKPRHLEPLTWREEANVISLPCQSLTGNSREWSQSPLAIACGGALDGGSIFRTHRTCYHGINQVTVFQGNTASLAIGHPIQALWWLFFLCVQSAVFTEGSTRAHTGPEAISSQITSGCQCLNRARGMENSEKCHRL